MYFFLLNLTFSDLNASESLSPCKNIFERALECLNTDDNTASSGFESSILTVVNLKALGVPQIYARAESLIQGQVLSKIGATEVIYPEIESAQRWAYKLITPQITEKIDFAPGYSIASVIAPAGYHRKTVLDLQLRQKYRVNLVSIKRGEKTEDVKQKGEVINVPLPDTVIYEGDILMVAGSDADLAKLPQE